MTLTVNRGYSTPATGADVDTWGANDLNPNFALIDNNIGGVSNIALSNANVTLTSTQYQCGTIRLSGALTGAVSVIFPVVQGWWTIDNQTTGAFVATITIGSGQVIAVDQGTAADILIDGTNVKFRNLPQVGSYMDVVETTIPAWVAACTVPPYLLCDGSTFSAVTYPYLNTKLGGNTLPDFQGRAPYYLNGGTGRLTSAGAGIDGNTRFASGGQNGITAAGLPAHTHPNTLTDPGHGHVIPLWNSTGPGGNGDIPASSAINVITSTSTNVAATGITINNVNNTSGVTTMQNAAPGAVSGIRLIRAA